MRTVQKGFTLIELVVVIVILGILAVTALPKFIDLTTDASQAAVSGVAGALSSASAINYAAKKAGNAAGLTVANCTDAAALLQGGVLPGAAGDYVISGAPVTPAGTSVNCTLTENKNKKTATFVAIGA